MHNLVVFVTERKIVKALSVSVSIAVVLVGLFVVREEFWGEPAPSLRGMVALAFVFGFALHPIGYLLGSAWAALERETGMDLDNSGAQGDNPFDDQQVVKPEHIVEFMVVAKARGSIAREDYCERTAESGVIVPAFYFQDRTKMTQAYHKRLCDLIKPVVAPTRRQGKEGLEIDAV